MNRRQDANRAMKDLHKTKLQGKPMTIAWAPGKGLKEVCIYFFRKFIKHNICVIDRVGGSNS